MHNNYLRSALIAVIVVLSIQQGHAQNTWTSIAAFGGGERERAVSFVIGGRAYVGTGLDTTNTCKKDFWEYDQGSNSWTQKADLPGSQRRDAIAFTIGSRGYVGTGLNGFIAWSGTKRKDFYEYNPITNTWTAKKDFEGNFGYGIYYAGAFSTDTKGYLVCGKTGPSSYSNELWEYDPIANDWIKKANFPGGVRYGVAAFGCGGKGYVGCGTDENYFNNDFYEYDPQTNIWTQKADFPGSARFNPAAFSIDGRGFVGLGTDGGYQKDLYEYNPLTDSWMQKANLPGSERRSVVAFTIGSYGYVGTGKGPDGVKQSMFKYKPYFLFDDNADDQRLAATTIQTNYNPAIEIVNGDSENPLTIHIFGINGQQLATQTIPYTERIPAHVFDLPSGMYVYTVAQQNEVGETESASGKILIY